MHTAKAYIIITIVYILMYFSNKCQLFCTCEQMGGGKRGGMVCESLLKPLNVDGYDEMQDTTEINKGEIK